MSLNYQGMKEKKQKYAPRQTKKLESSHSPLLCT